MAGADNDSGGLLKPRVTVDSDATPPDGALLRPREEVRARPPASNTGLLTERAQVRVPHAAPPASVSFEKARPAAAEATPVDRAAIMASLKSLGRGAGTLLELLFPERTAEDLTRQRPDERRYHDRVQQVERDLDEADKDGGNDFPAKMVREARANFGEATRRGASEAAEHEAAVAQLVERQAALLLAEVRKHALPGSTVLYASDLLKIEAHARTLGFSPELAVDLARDNGFTPWSPKRVAVVLDAPGRSDHPRGGRRVATLTRGRGIQGAARRGRVGLARFEREPRAGRRGGGA
ncbi:MAG: hypothetical protein U0326_07270 [Polyangiales bacterium]